MIGNDPTPTPFHERAERLLRTARQDVSKLKVEDIQALVDDLQAEHSRLEKKFRETQSERVKLQQQNEELEQRVGARTVDLRLRTDQLAQQSTELEERAAALRRLATKLSEAEHRERKRLAKLLHDDLQQLLLAVQLRLPLLVDADRDQLQQHVEKIDKLIGECLSTSRDLTHELSPPILRYGTLADVLQWLGKWFSDRHGLHVVVDVGEQPPPLPEPVRVFFFHAVRELLVNAAKHSGSKQAHVILTCQGVSLTVQVEDGGHGFDPAAIESCLRRPTSYGLFGIRERFEALGGQMKIDSTAAGGACFRLRIPVQRAMHSAFQNGDHRETDMASHRAGETSAERPVTRLLIVDDHSVVREGFVGLLGLQPDMQVVGEAANGEEAIYQAEALRPDAVIMDAEMPILNGIDATRRIKQQLPDIIVVGLSLHEDGIVDRAMLEAGADAYVSKHAPAKELVGAIRRACGGASTDQ